MLSHARDETWGRVVYDRDTDEFEAHVRDESASRAISRPLSEGCLVTGLCNLKCAFCYGNDESLPKVDIGLAEWNRIFQRFRSWGLIRVDLSGGEPTIRKDLPKIACAAIDAGLQVVISTNGIPLSEIGAVGFPDVRWHVSFDSGIPEIHERSRLLRSLTPSKNSFEKTSRFVERCLESNQTVRALTCVGPHNKDALFGLGEHLALLGVTDWNISRILRAGRAQGDYDARWGITDESVLEQVHNLRHAFPFIRIRYSNRTTQDGYFLLVLPDGSLATQYTDGQDKVILGSVLHMGIEDLRNHPKFNLLEHGKKWIAAEMEWQAEYETLYNSAQPPSLSMSM